MEDSDLNPYTSIEEYRAQLAEKDRQAASHDRLRADFESVWASDAGRRVLEYLCKDVCGEGRSCFSENPIIMARLAGRHEVALIIRGFFEGN